MLHVELVTLWDLVRLKMGRDPSYGIPICQGMSRAQVHYIIMAGSIKEVAAGEALFRKGDTSDSMYALISGALDVVDHAPDLDPAADPSAGKVLARLCAGDVMGEMGLLRGVPRSATLIADRPSELLCINLKMIRRLQWLYPPTAHKFFFNLMTILCDRLERASACLFENSLTDDCHGPVEPAKLHGQPRPGGPTGRAATIRTCPFCLFKIDPTRNPVHAGGELDTETLQLCSRTLSRHLRRSDILGRLGARTFALLLPNTPPQKAESISGRLVRLLKERLSENGSQTPGIAVGLAGMQGGREERTDLYACAATALKDIDNRLIHRLPRPAFRPASGFLLTLPSQIPIGAFRLIVRVCNPIIVTELLEPQ